MKKSIQNRRCVRFRLTDAAFAVSLAAAPAQAATISLSQDGHYFQGWDLGQIQPAANIPAPGYNCFSPPPDLPHDSVIKGTLGPLNYQIKAVPGTLAQPPADNQWQICNWIWGTNIPSGNDTTGTPGSMNYNKGSYDIQTTNGPFVPGTLMAFQDMDGIESARLTFKDCNGNVVDPAGFDTLVLSSNYTSTTAPIASSQYVGGSPPAWEFKSRSNGVPNVTIGVLLKAPNICAIRLVGPTAGGSGGVATFFAAPPTKTLAAATAVPTLQAWAMLALLGAVGSLGARRIRARRR